jgi:hypothetical protein
MFRTELSIQPSVEKINLSSSILSIGSCFAEIMGKRLHANKFHTLSNPFGVIFNPISVFELLSQSISNQAPEMDSYFENQGVFYNYNFHSTLSSPSLEKLKEKVKQSIFTTNHFLSKGNWLIVTLGTAYVYELKKTCKLVANCHKMPSSLFNKKLLSAEEITQSFKKLYQELHKINPELKIILTVSPVRHIKDSLELNNVSKSILRVSAHYLSATYDKVSYFPSYELILDDLRDYRFYKSDLIHPNDQAENYVWEKFSQAYFDNETLNFIKDWQKLLQAIHHKPFHPETEAHQNFIRKTIEKLTGLSEKINVGEEIKILQQQLLS